eukprot:CAMPEP_0117894584 /NCGR_PEP_ID=MMETSP0950-20121206/26070_1 /TAXON_ID=44440 /ORGANISM="Chattonella subsalsa, Strain CCMP2191" /LENGTH=86 /DNA_ID=CAMNT_0005755185 /DNA_START=1 /DNA_END=258 /DNA_ORIENTATION=-
MWECDFRRMLVKQKISHHLMREDLEALKPLIPRDAYFGGRVNCVKLLYDCRPNEQIHYLDITSMYPAIMSSEECPFPIGSPSIFRQ